MKIPTKQFLFMCVHTHTQLPDQSWPKTNQIAPHFSMIHPPGGPQFKLRPNENLGLGHFIHPKTEFVKVWFSNISGIWVGGLPN